MIDINKILEKPEVAVLFEILRLSNTEASEHSIRVAEIVSQMVKYSHIPEIYHEDIVTGALLHDIGKAFVPLNLTQLPQSLTKSEYDIVKIHAAVSYEIVKTAFSKIVCDICLYHHERIDGSGYLSEVSLSSIPEEVLLVQVADVYEALTQKRVYKNRYNEEEAIKILKQEADKMKLDDEFVNILEKVIKEGK